MFVDKIIFFWVEKAPNFTHNREKLKVIFKPFVTQYDSFFFSGMSTNFSSSSHEASYSYQ